MNGWSQIGHQSQLPHNRLQKFTNKVARNRSRSARTGSQARVRRPGSQEQAQVPSKNSVGRFRTMPATSPRTGPQARFLSRALKHSFLGKVMNNRLTGKVVKQGSKAKLQERFNEQVPKHDVSKLIKLKLHQFLNVCVWRNRLQLSHSYCRLTFMSRLHLNFQNRNFTEIS